MRFKVILAYLFVSVCFLNGNISEINAQEMDTVSIVKSNRLTKLPVKASIYSAVLPGAGQLYNKKYWKAPVVWVGMGAFGYFAYSNNQEFLRYRNAYLIREDEGIDEFYDVLTLEGIKNEMERWRRYRDLNIIGATLFYVIQIIDANVDASLSDFDVSDDLSLHFGVSQNMYYQGKQPLSLSLSLKF